MGCAKGWSENTSKKCIGYQRGAYARLCPKDVPMQVCDLLLLLAGPPCPTIVPACLCRISIDSFLLASFLWICLRLMFTHGELNDFTL